MKGTDQLLRRLRRLKELRRERSRDAEKNARLHRITEWQGRRLARTHADLLESPRYRPAVRFFLDDLYAPRDYSRRDRDLMKISPLLARALPESALHTMGLALEMNVLTEEVDAAMDRALIELEAVNPLTEEIYARAYRRCDDAARRRRQIELIREVGQDLDQVVQRPWVEKGLRMARRPARMSGLEALHELLVRGFYAFRGMNGAGEFLDAICGREMMILERIYDRHPEPFAPLFVGPAGTSRLAEARAVDRTSADLPIDTAALCDVQDEDV